MPVLSSAVEKFGNKIRVRVCGLFYDVERLLLLNHKGLYGHDFWAPPGGGVEFGETAEQALKREFLEECNLEVKVGNFLFACEFVKPPLHAIELFFEVSSNGNAKLGHDPELADGQLLTDLKHWGSSDLHYLPPNYRHGILGHGTEPKDLLRLRGYFRLPDV